jgi:hypothetical protein
MWPLSIFLFFAIAAPQQDSTAATQFPLQGKMALMQQKLQLMQQLRSGNLDPQAQRNLCFTMRSYVFRRQDGQAPVPAGMTTCTPASILQQRQVSPSQKVKFVPLGAQQDEQSPQDEQK